MVSTKSTADYFVVALKSLNSIAIRICFFKMFKLCSYTKLFIIQERVGLSESSSFSSVDCEVKERRAVSDSVHMDVSRKLTKHNSQSTSSASSPAKDKSRKSE